MAMTEEQNLMWDLAKAFRKWERDDTGKNLAYFVKAAGLEVVRRLPKETK